MVVRKDKKVQTHRRIVEEASHLFREKGLNGAGVAEVMKAAGLTHGGFYAHFTNKDDLVLEAFQHAIDTKAKTWFKGLDDMDDDTWVKRLIARYLRNDHKENVADGCAFAALGPELARADDFMKAALEPQIRDVATTIAQHLDGPKPDPKKCAEGAGDRALALYSLCIGAMILARSVKSRRMSDRILKASREFAAKGVKY